MKSHKFWSYLIIAVVLNIIFVAVYSLASINELMSRVCFYLEVFAPDVLLLLMIILAIRYYKKTKDNHPRLKACLLFLTSAAITFITKKLLYYITLAITSLLTMYHSNDEIYPYLISVQCNNQAWNNIQSEVPNEKDSTTFSSDENIQFRWAKFCKIDIENIENLSYSDSILSLQWTIDKNGIMVSGKNKTKGILSIDSMKIVSSTFDYYTDDINIIPIAINAQDSTKTINENSQFNLSLTNNINFLDSIASEHKSLHITFTVATENDIIEYNFLFTFYNRWKGKKEKHFWVRENDMLMRK